jgi:NADH-quinone oxidoreductase subunit H
MFLVTILWGGLGSWWAALKFLLIVVLIVLAKNTNPRFKIEHAVRFLWFGVGVLGIAAVVLAFLGL